MNGRLNPGQLTELAPGIRRVLAPNPGPMTGPGTNTYLLGDREVAVIDPGPASDTHVDAVLNGAPGTIKWILVTHTHLDHSPAARALAGTTGAKVLGRPAPAGASQEAGFAPARLLDNDERLVTGEFTLRAVHTPGHASNHLCYLLEKCEWLFTGDHIMNGSTVVINPPDGNMQQYLDSLRRLKTLRLQMLAPGHGELIDTPYAAVDWIIEHRLQREAGVLAALQTNPDKSAVDLVPVVYRDIGEHLHGVAVRSLLAHLLKLEDDGRAQRNAERWRLTED
ncbi:MAG: MBL fold metallo-hydrolase [Gammaproteobacteria bacterium]|nr:MBL fold metallo-hydrolase [Gammaproteobacteria bacterium]